MKMAEIGLPKGSGKQLKVREKSVKSNGNFEMDIEWQPCFDLIGKALISGTTLIVSEFVSISWC